MKRTENRKAQVAIRLTEKEKKALEKRASDQGDTVSAFLRKYIRSIIKVA